MKMQIGKFAFGHGGASMRAMALLCLLFTAGWSDAAHDHAEPSDAGACYSCHFSPEKLLGFEPAAMHLRGVAASFHPTGVAVPAASSQALLPPPRGPPQHS